MKKNQKNLKLLLSKKKINNRITELAKQISKDYKGKKPVFIGVLNGSFIFLADLIRNMSIDCEVAFINAKSYSGNKSTGKIEILDDMNLNIFEKDIIIVEDIIDSGRTIKFLYDRFMRLSPNSIEIASLLYKPSDIQFDFPIAFIGFEIPQVFVVGYGLDYNGKMRHLDSIYFIDSTSKQLKG